MRNWLGSSVPTTNGLNPASETSACDSCGWESSASTDFSELESSGGFLTSSTDVHCFLLIFMEHACKSGITKDAQIHNQQLRLVFSERQGVVIDQVLGHHWRRLDRSFDSLFLRKRVSKQLVQSEQLASKVLYLGLLPKFKVTTSLGIWVKSYLFLSNFN